MPDTRTTEPLEVYLLGVGYVPEIEKLNAKFRYWHVEPLLNQAADLLDRCLKDRSEYNALRAQWEILLDQTKAARKELQVMEQRIAEGWFSPMIPVLSGEIQSREQLFTPRNFWNEIESHYNNLSQAYFNETGAEHKQIFQTGAQNLQNLISRHLAATELNSKRMQLQGEQRDEHYRRQLLEDAKIRFNYKESLMKDRGPLSYELQYLDISSRLSRDFTDAYDRLTVAVKGMNLLYGYTIPLPDNTYGPDRLPPIDASVEFVRNAIEWLVAFGQLDQGWTHVSSIRSLVGEDVWSKTISSAVEGVALDTQDRRSITFSFHIPTESFQSHQYARLRGMGAYIVGPKLEDGPWSGFVNVPSKSISFQKDEQGLEVRKDLDQGELPSCFLGRIENRNSPRAPEIAGIVSLMNASPIGIDSQEGEWLISVSPPRRANGNIKILEDIELELNLLGQPKR